MYVSRSMERRRLAEAQEDGGEVRIARAMHAEIKSVDGSPREFDFTISTASVDRYGDTVSVTGWDLKAFRRNPVVLWGHDNSMLPVGQAKDIRVEGDALKARVVFGPEGESRFNDTVAAMVARGALRATSVGFIPKKFAFVDSKERSGIDFIEQELLEFSIVSVPANAEALIDGRSFDAEPVTSEPPPPVGMSADLAAARVRVARLSLI